MTDVKYFSLPFAVDGDRTAVPDAPPGDGTLSYDQGYNLYYAQQLGVNPTAKAISREQYNQVLYDVTFAIQQIQQIGAPQFITTTMNDGSPYSYAENARVWQPSDGNIYESLINSNTDVPPTSNWKLVSITAPGYGIQASFKKLKITNGGTPNSQVTLTADLIQLQNSTSQNYVARNVSVTASTGSSGANGLDTGAVAANTFYAIYAIYNPDTATVAALLSTNATTPTLPSGYTFYARLGWMLTDGSSNLKTTLQLGRSTQYVITGTSPNALIPVMATGTTAGANIATGAFVPSTASKIKVSLYSATNTSDCSVYPNANYSGTGNIPMYSSGEEVLLGEIMLESSNIHWVSNISSSNQIMCFGWEDNI